MATNNFQNIEHLAEGVSFEGIYTVITEKRVLQIKCENIYDAARALNKRERVLSAYAVDPLREGAFYTDRQLLG